MFEFILAVFLLEVTPGPNMAYLATLALARGRTAGLYATLGVALGLIQHYPWLYETLRWTGVAYLLFLAWQGWSPEKENSPGRADLLSTAGPLFLRGFLSNVFNPKSILFFISVVPTFVRSSPGDPSFPLQMMIFGILYVGIATAVHAAIVMLAAELRPWLVEGPRQRLARRILSIALALVAVWLGWTTRR
jgi:threonine/homoserine/homoserine lactone efflux protein